MKDLTFRFATAAALMFLRWSNWWGDLAEAIHTGASMAKIRREREERADDDQA